MRAVRFIVWGAVVGAAIATASTLEFAWWKDEYPFRQNKLASQSVIKFGSRIGLPFGAIAGAAVGFTAYRLSPRRIK